MNKLERISQISLIKSSEPEIDDCVEYFKKCEAGESVFRDRANGDDAGYVEYPEEEVEDDRTTAEN